MPSKNNDKSADIAPKKVKRLTKYDELAIQLVKSNPDLNNEQIGKEIVRLGASKNPKTIHHKWRVNDYLRAEIQAVRAHSREKLDRIMLPKALKVARKALDNNELTEKDKFRYVKLVVDKSFGDIVHTDQPQVVNVGTIEKMQVVISKDLGVD